MAFVIEGESGPMSKADLIKEAAELYPTYNIPMLLRVLDNSYGPEITFTYQHIKRVIQDPA